MAIYDKFAKQYSDSMGEEGDINHKSSIDPYIYEIIGDPKNKVIYDLGCGNGYMARCLAKKGAKVLASDASRELIKIAEEKSKGLDISYSVRDATDFDGFDNNKFDVVVMNMVVHYIENLDLLFREISKHLKAGGVFAFSTSHFFRPGHPYSDWVEGKVGGKPTLFIKVTNYLQDYTMRSKSWWDNKTDLAFHVRPLNKFINTMSKYGLLTEKVFEPESDKWFARDFPEELRETHHIPTYIIFGAIKK